jgi:putative flippase GtrA
VSFSVIGLASTAVSLGLFLFLRDPLGAVGANAVAVSVTFVGNTWANARFTTQSHRPRWRSAFAIYLGSLAMTSVALVVVDAFGGGLGAQVGALAVTWTAATLGRLALVRRSTVRDRAR